MCTGVCPTVTRPANGAVSVNSLFVNGIARYSCGSGYEVVGTPSCTCQSTGVWSCSPPTCEGEYPCMYTVSRSEGCFSAHFHAFNPYYNQYI